MIDHPRVEADVPLAPLTTYKVGGSARLFAEPTDLAELRELLSLVPEGVPVIVLGRGSNVVISDRGIDGLVIRLGRAFQSVAMAGDAEIVAGGGLALPKLARFAASHARAGLGFYVGIPGSVGGAVRMNAGGHGSDTSGVLQAALVLDSSTRQITTRTPLDLELEYRTSNLCDTDIVVQARFATAVGDSAVLEEQMREITRWRKDNQPGGTLNAGSVFKNPEGDFAGAIIDRAGLKGAQFGSVHVSSVHANFLVAADVTTADDIFSYVQHIRSIIFDRTGIDLEPEIRFLGEFEAREDAS